MRGLGLLDILIILSVVGLLVFAATQDFVHYDGRGLTASPTATPAEAQ